MPNPLQTQRHGNALPQHQDGAANVPPAWKILPEGARHDTIVCLGFGRLGLCGAATVAAATEPSSEP